jgi:hypothetical protein
MLSSVNSDTRQPHKQAAKEVIAANVQALIDQLEQGKSEALIAYLSAMARFHNYSFGNILSIARFRPDATHVAGIRTWNELGRHVTKGEKGIPILAPMIGNKRQRSDEPTERGEKPVPVLMGFRVVYVFERLSRDLRSRFYTLDMARGTPQGDSDGSHNPVE